MNGRVLFQDDIPALRLMPLFDPKTTHQPGYACPKKWQDGDIHYELDVVAPPAWDRDQGWGFVLMATVEGAPPFLSRWSGPTRPTKRMEIGFLKKAIEGTRRFYAALKAGCDPAQAATKAPL